MPFFDGFVHEGLLRLVVALIFLWLVFGFTLRGLLTAGPGFGLVLGCGPAGCVRSPGSFGRGVFRLWARVAQATAWARFS
jgi:hypothetical protein